MDLKDFISDNGGEGDGEMKDNNADDAQAAADASLQQQDYPYLDVLPPSYSASVLLQVDSVPLEKRGEDYQERMKQLVLPFLQYIRLLTLFLS